VIERARAEHHHDRCCEDGCRDTWPAAVSVGDEQGANHERYHERSLMEHSAQQRPFAVRHVSQGSSAMHELILFV
jgi:hypothetical protein